MRRPTFRCAASKTGLVVELQRQTIGARRRIGAKCDPVTSLREDVSAVDLIGEVPDPGLNHPLVIIRVPSEPRVANRVLGNDVKRIVVHIRVR